jgi:hypothetical protein
MGTRGAIGFFIDGKTVAAYNHYDSYPDYLGRKVIKALRGRDMEQVKASAKAVETINENVPPTQEQIDRCKAAGTVDLSVSNRSENDWYCLLRGAQGDIAGLLDGKVPYMSGNGAEFLSDSLFCEYAYIINFDEGLLEFYKGFNKDMSAPGRYAKVDKPDRQGYVGVALAGTIPLQELQDGVTEEDALVKRMKVACGESEEEAA